MITTAPAATPAGHSTALTGLHAAFLAAGKHASTLFHRFVQARIATECNGPVRPLSRRGAPRTLP